MNSKIGKWDFSVRLFLVLALAAFLVANLIHNNWKIDLAVAPSAILAWLYFRFRFKLFAILGAALIALPSFRFLNWDVLFDPPTQIYFANHAALFVAGVLAASCVLSCLLWITVGKSSTNRLQTS